MAEFALAGCLVFAVIDWWAVARGSKELEYVAKPATLGLLILYATANPEPSWWLITALVFSLLGDVYLMLPGGLFLPGLAAFLVAHVAYIAAFDVPTITRLGWLVGILVVLSPLAIRIIRSVNLPALRSAIGVYMIVIALMVASAVASVNAVAICGALLFLASDSLLAWNRFVRALPWAPTGIMVTYHLGQLGLVVALR